MRAISVLLVTSLLSGHPLVVAAEPAAGDLLGAALREATRLAALEVQAAPVKAPSKKRDGHPVLIGTAIGAGVGAAVGYAGTSCSVPPPDDEAACGTHYKGGAALLGAGLGAGLGALIGLAFRH